MFDNNNIENFEIFPWDDNFEIGIQEIDHQHKTIVLLLNKLANNLIKEEKIEIEETFTELANYADYHFECEEKIWEENIEDNDIKVSHRFSHSSFLPKIIELKEKNKDKPYNEMIEEILLFLIRWLAFHIIDEDKRLSLIIQETKKGKNFNEAIDSTEDIMNGSMKILIDTILSMYDNLSLKAINLIRERKRRIEAEKKLQKLNIELKNLSVTDQLTNLYNRRHFDDVFERELKTSKRKKTIFTILLVDIDHFKNINDTYGHAIGDDVLRNVSNCLIETCKRPSDFVFRVGGEEFAIIISNEKEDNIKNLSEILQNNIKELKIINESGLNTKYLTLTGGVYSKIPTQEETKDSIMKIVDDKLYQGKTKGRNQIIL